MSLSFLTIIACGGEGRRFGGPKWSAELGGVALIEHAIARARGYGAPIALAVREGMGMDVPGLTHLDDDLEDIGPVSALLSGFRHASEQGVDAVLLLACDQPFLPHDLASRLIEAIADSGVAAPRSNGHDQLMAALWRVDLPSLDDYIAGGGRSLWHYAESRGLVRVEWDDHPADPFADIDDREALEAARARWRAEHS
ncbi:MAG: molybdenum cofactor guanylyltransferase [Erythrobacter sp.]